MFFFPFGLFLDVLIFCLGCYWMYHLWGDLPKHIRDLKSTNPKTEKWPVMVVLGASILLLNWMVGFVLGYLIGPILRAI